MVISKTASSASKTTSQRQSTPRRKKRPWYRLEPARQLRNHIAHGLLRMALAGDQKTWTHTLSLPRDLDGAGAPQARHLTYQELLKAGMELTQLIEAFKSLFGNWVADANVSS